MLKNNFTQYTIFQVILSTISRKMLKIRVNRIKNGYKLKNVDFFLGKSTLKRFEFSRKYCKIVVYEKLLDLERFQGM